MLGEIVCKVVTSTTPMDNELSLIDAIAYPIESHVDRLGAALLDCIVDDAGSACVVCLNEGRRLRMSHFFEDVSDHDAVLGVVE